jgi:hypothetical protein
LLVTQHPVRRELAPSGHELLNDFQVFAQIAREDGFMMSNPVSQQPYFVQVFEDSFAVLCGSPDRREIG